MKSVARYAYRRRWLILALWVVLFLGMNALSQTFGTAYANTFTLPGTNSTHALSLLQSGFKSKSGDVDEIVFQAKSGTIASHRAAILAMDKRVEKVKSVASVVSPFVGGSLQISPNGKIAYSVVYFKTQGYKLKAAQIQPVETAGITARSPSLNVQFAGNAFEQLASQKSPPDLKYGLILTAIVLFLAFGSLFAMLLPLGVALFAVGIATAATTLLSHGISIATFAPLLGSLIGLGVGIDYALFIVTRCRQGLKRGLSRGRRDRERDQHLRSRRALRRLDRVHRALGDVRPAALVPLRRRHRGLAHRVDHDVRVIDVAPGADGLHGHARVESPRAPQARGERPRADRAQHRLAALGQHRHEAPAQALARRARRHRLHLRPLLLLAPRQLGRGHRPGRLHHPPGLRPPRPGLRPRLQRPAAGRRLDPQRQGRGDHAGAGREVAGQARHRHGGAAPDLPERQGRGHLRRAQVQPGLQDHREPHRDDPQPVRAGRHREEPHGDLRGRPDGDLRRLRLGLHLQDPVVRGRHRLPGLPAC